MGEVVNYRKEYIGDGVYAEMDGYMIKLTTVRHDEGSMTHVIYLEPKVYAALVEFAKRQWPEHEEAEGKL